MLHIGFWMSSSLAPKILEALRSKSAGMPGVQVTPSNCLPVYSKFDRQATIRLCIADKHDEALLDLYNGYRPVVVLELHDEDTVTFNAELFEPPGPIGNIGGTGPSVSTKLAQFSLAAIASGGLLRWALGEEAGAPPVIDPPEDPEADVGASDSSDANVSEDDSDGADSGGRDGSD